MDDTATPTIQTTVAHLVAKALSLSITLATAESCTGGLLAHLFTQIAGVSQIYAGSVVAYANSAKRDLLGVPQELLDEHGAVSEPVALAMARGARERFHVTLAVATTGVAGPSGGSEEKPVGLTFVAVSWPSGELCRRFRFEGDRAENIVEAAQAALQMVDEALSTLPN